MPCLKLTLNYCFENHCKVPEKHVSNICGLSDFCYNI